MTDSEITVLGDAFANILISHAAHGFATSSLAGMGEITLRDGLVVAAAAVAAELRQGWLLTREFEPPDWQNADVDLLISRRGNGGETHLLAGLELKWWRREDGGNAANRRKDLVRDFFRAAALYSLVEQIAFVALLSTSASWDATATTDGSDHVAMGMLGTSGAQQWNINPMIASSAVRGAMRDLVGDVPITNIFHTKLISNAALHSNDQRRAFAKVWSVKKPQNSRFLDPDEVETLLLGWP
ncbi:MAG TPA: hypothetical protein VGW39_08145 [Chthoniobacterales bacterium]|nr:hypothetical protein [Chthoniobacterales bacterium]